MGLLSSAYEDAIKSSKHPENFVRATTQFGHSTGIDLLDYMNGKWIDVKNDKGYYSVGVDQGSYVCLIGKSGTSKTSLAIQMAYNIIKPYEEGLIYLDDIEAATDEVRIHKLTKMDYDEIHAKVIHRQSGITCESFYENINMIYTKKMQLAKEHPAEFMIHTGKKNTRGEEIIIMPPTVYILDSLALLVPENISQEEQVSGQMSTTAAAKMNAKVFRQIIPKIKKANIVLIVINHINTKIEINPMVHTKAAVNYLKPDEATVGGNTPIYLANNIWKLEAGDKLVADKTFGINGFTVKITMIKSRSNRAGQEGIFVFNQEKGYDNALTNLNYFNDNKILKGAGVGYYFEEDPNTKFRLSTFKDKLRDNKDFRILVKKLVKATYSNTFISKADDDDLLTDENFVHKHEESTESTPKKKKKK